MMWERFCFYPLALTIASIAVLASCSKKKSMSSSPASSIADPNFERPLSPNSFLSIGRQNLVGTKIITKNDSLIAGDPGFKAFEANLYPKLRQYCASGCHDVNKRPFASEGVTLAYEVARPFLTANPDDSPMVQNIRASHNGTNPEWAPEVAAAIAKVVEATTP